IGTKKREPGQVTIFKTHSGGLKTGRDSWAYNSSRAVLGSNIHELIHQYRTVTSAFHAHARVEGLKRVGEADVTAFLQAHPEHVGTGKISWNSKLKQHAARGRENQWDPGAIYEVTYRPFNKQWTYFDRHISDR